MEQEEKVGQQLGNYRLLRIIGSGGYATVYLGEHRILKTQAAIKVLKVVELTDEQQELLLEEARIVAKLAHRHIIRVLECGIEKAVNGSIPYIVMSYAPAGSIRNKYPHGAIIPFDAVISYTNQVADALHYAHSKQIIHCDVKPENMLISSPNEILLSDFGIAGRSHTEFLDRPELMSNPAQIPGTPFYMAPERLLQGIRRRATDQYALGIVVYEWLAGEPPFTGNVERVIHQHASVSPPSLRAKNPSVPQEVERVVMRALEKEPSQRYAEIKEFASALEEAFRHVAPPPIVTSFPPEEQPENGQQLSFQPTIIEPPSAPKRVTPVLLPATPLQRPAMPLAVAPQEVAQAQPLRSPQPIAPQPAVPSQAMRQPQIAYQPSGQSQPPDPQPYAARQQWQYQSPAGLGGQASATSPHNATTVNIQPPLPPDDEGTFNEFKEMFTIPRGTFDSWFDNRFATLQEQRWFRRINMFALFLSTFVVALVLHSWYVFLFSLLTLPIFYCCIRLVKPVFAGFLGGILALYWGWVAWTIAEPLNTALRWFPPTSIVATAVFLFALFVHMRYVTNRLP